MEDDEDLEPREDIEDEINNPVDYESEGGYTQLGQTIYFFGNLVSLALFANEIYYTYFSDTEVDVDLYTISYLSAFGISALFGIFAA